VRSWNHFRIFGSVSVFSRIALRSRLTKPLVTLGDHPLLKPAVSMHQRRHYHRSADADTVGISSDAIPMLSFHRILAIHNLSADPPRTPALANKMVSDNIGAL
jgi:hypothetical protein